jgi:hypothetical protein
MVVVWAMDEVMCSGSIGRYSRTPGEAQRYTQDIELLMRLSSQLCLHALLLGFGRRNPRKGVNVTSGGDTGSRKEAKEFLLPCILKFLFFFLLFLFCGMAAVNHKSSLDFLDWTFHPACFAAAYQRRVKFCCGEAYPAGMTRVDVHIKRGWPSHN